MEHDTAIGRCDDEQAEHGTLVRSPGGPVNPKGAGQMVMHDDDLDDLDEDDQEPVEGNALVRRLRAQIKDQGRQLKKALEDGKQIGRDERDRELAWERSGIPARVRTLMADVDPRDRHALAAKVAELQADGLSWHGSPDLAAAAAAEQAGSASLGRMAHAAATGQHVSDLDGDKAAAIKHRIDTGQDVDQAEAEWFMHYTAQAAAALGAAQGKGF
jgi:hypothetical protein